VGPNGVPRIGVDAASTAVVDRSEGGACSLGSKVVEWATIRAPSGPLVSRLSYGDSIRRSPSCDCS
jgi:hypothetical protein